MTAFSSSARVPLALAAAAFAAGILLSAYVQRPAWLWGWAALLLVACAMIACMKAGARLALTTVLLAFIAAGAFSKFNAPVPHVTAPPEEFLYRHVEIVGHVIKDGALLGDGLRDRFDVESERISFSDDHGVSHEFRQPVSIRLTAYLPDYSLSPQELAKFQAQLAHLVYGQRVDLDARLRAPRNFRNPGAFDYAGYLRGLGIGATGSVKADSIVSLAGRSGNRVGVLRSAVRRSILGQITGSGLWDRRDSALLAAMVIGHDSLLLRGVRDQFQETGVYHLLVVSGMNVGLLAFAVFWLARRLRAPDWLASLVTLGLAVFYAQIAGMGVPIERAVLMLALFLVARLVYRGRAPLNAAGFAALVVLIVSPQALFEAGFQLTFLAMLAIFGIGVPLLERTSEPCRRAVRHLNSTAYDLHLSPRLAQLRLDLRMIAERLSSFIGRTPARWLVVGTLSGSFAFFDITVVSSIIQAALVLPMRVYFHRAAIIGMPANILALPLAGVLLNAAAAAIALSYVSMPLARLAAFVASACLHWTLTSIGWLSHLHISQWRVAEPGTALWLLAAVSIGTALLAVRRRPAVIFAGLAALFIGTGIAAFAHATPSLQPHDLEITVIDVGQGDSILVVAPDGATMLIDAGGSLSPAPTEFDFGEDVVSPYLWWRGLDRLDVVALTHAHADHIGGLARVIDNFHPRELWLGIDPETPALDHVLAVASADHVTVRRHTAGDALEWHGTEIRVLSPPPDYRPGARPKNDDSLALLISYQHTSALLAGDIEKKMESFVATESPRADVLKVAHHGSATSSTPEFLNAVQPRFAAISVGWQNSFHHPRPEVLARLQADHVRTYRTDMLGLTSFFLDGKNVTAKTAADY
ncbi:MAG TPA: ComEC/Rec2 family competence protein [Candidatus Angelobacter sp.]|nr:ComEC/Rec2 family competence protein [Candidatus Angelobacter sp.]